MEGNVETMNINDALKWVKGNMKVFDSYPDNIAPFIKIIKYNI